MVPKEDTIMPTGLRVALIVGAILMLAYVLNKIRKAQLQTNDAVFWFLFAGCVVVVSIFPQIIFCISQLIGIQSPANLVFLIIVAILVIKLLGMSVENAKLKQKIDRLTQFVALHSAFDDFTNSKN